MLSTIEKYILSFYFVVATMTTVGYGDMHAWSNFERIYLIFMMMCGVFVFSAFQGSLTSILQTMDQSNAQLEEKMLQLNKLSS